MLQKISTAKALVDVIDRVLDKGIAFDTRARLSRAGIGLITPQAHVTVASIDTYLSSLELRRVLFIVNADRRGLFEALRQNSVTWTNVVLDRRRRQRRRRNKMVAKNHRHVERRVHDIDANLKSIGMAVVLP